MGYVGNQQTEGFSKIPPKQDLTGATGASLTLSHAVSSPESIDLFINNVRQEPTESYTTDGTTVNLVGYTVAATDDIYVVYNALVRQTSTHPSTAALEAASGTFSGDLTVDTNTLYVDSTNNRVGVGTSSPSVKLEIDAGSSSGTPLQLTTTGSGHNFDMVDFDSTARIRNVNGYLRIGADHNNESGNSRIQFEVDGSEVARLDSSGNVLVGKISASESTAGTELNANGYALFVRDGNRVAQMNRLTSDGQILRFTKDGTTRGAIGCIGDDIYIDGLGSSGSGIRFESNQLRPRRGGGDIDNSVDLGGSNFRFDDVYATNGTIQTSDENEKQQIASLTSAEITAAKAISKLFKTFKWNDSVTENGTNARTHTGVIAQQVETAMTDAGLDAGDYAFFISDTWTDDDGNSQTRKGIRYPELLSFVGAATEQRLADIETRLTALENA